VPSINPGNYGKLDVSGKSPSWSHRRKKQARTESVAGLLHWRVFDSQIGKDERVPAG
jgi:hypothetical protein